MKNIVKYLILIVLSISFSFISIKADSSYEIDSYDVNIVVNENNKLEIKETIDAYFKTAKHGIIRTIPIKNNIYREDGTKQVSKSRIKIKSINEEYTTERNSDYYNIKIGKSNRTITGKKTYVIDYDYFIRKDNSDTYDEFYYNIIGTQWDTNINKVTFKITLPKEFDTSKVGFSVGYTGVSGYLEELLTYNIDGTTITGSYNAMLNSHEGITIRIELPEGYFIVDNSFSTEEIAIIGISLALLALATFIWLKYCKEEPVVETVEFYPPDGISPLDLALIYNGDVSSNDVVSLLIVLANKGYIKISEHKEPGIMQKDGFLIKKIKEYDGDDEYEKIFMKDLFDCKKNKSGLIDQVTNKDLENEFYKTINKIEYKAKNTTNKKKYYEDCKKRKWLFVIMFMIIAISTVYPIYIYSPDLLSVLSFIITIVYLGQYFTVASASRRAIIPSIISLTICMIISVSFCLIDEIKYETFLLVTISVGFVSSLIILYYRYTSRRRTKKGRELYGKILGFKRFLETAEKDKLEALVSQTPEYFYNILPYTYVLGISKKWIKKFETIAIQKPEWYDTPDAFDYYRFSRFMNSTMVTARTSMASSPSSSSSRSSGGFSGGGFSGGGFSGGGSGGGGGSSW